MRNFAFLHVGNDGFMATTLVQSLRRMHADARIVQCTDRVTPAIAGADSVFRFDGDTGKLMTFKLRCFADIELPSATLFLDTDMVCVKPVDPVAALGDNDVAVCVREFDVNRTFKAKFGTMALNQYSGMPMGAVYPFVACATITRKADFWRDCLANLLSLDPKFQDWYGDQEAIRNVIGQKRYKAGTLPESIYACLPERESARHAAILHFKGRERKSLMQQHAVRLAHATP